MQNQCRLLLIALLFYGFALLILKFIAQSLIWYGFASFWHFFTHPKFFCCYFGPDIHTEIPGKSSAKPMKPIKAHRSSLASNESLLEFIFRIFWMYLGCFKENWRRNLPVEFEAGWSFLFLGNLFQSVWSVWSTSPNNKEIIIHFSLYCHYSQTI